MTNRPILVSSCARAATAAEARFRLPILVRATWRSARVIALDAEAAVLVAYVAERQWHGARFFTTDPGVVDGAADVVLQGTDNVSSRLSAELDGADLVVMVAAAEGGAAVAAAIGLACSLRSIMTAGIVLDGRERTDAVVSALRPYARVLMVTRDEQDLAEVLLALRA